MVLELLGPLLAAFFGTFFAISLLAGAGEQLSAEFPWQFRLAAKLRTPMLVFIVVPLSCAYRFCIRVRDRARRLLRGDPALALGTECPAHIARVECVQRAVRAAVALGQQMRTARSSWQQMSVKLNSNKSGAARIETRHLNHILQVDEEGMTVTAEPFVTMGQMMDELLPRGLSLAVMIEMDSISLGGVAMGFGIETNSHREGFFQESVLRYDLVTAAGELRSVSGASDAEGGSAADRELFAALPWSMGCLGFLTSLKLRIVRVKSHVLVEYTPTSSAAELQERMTRLAHLPDTDARKPTFLEATAYSASEAVMQVARYAEPGEAPPGTPTVPINRWWKPFYYKHVQRFLAAEHVAAKRAAADGVAYRELIPLRHYYARFSRSIFWELDDMIPFASHPLYRALWGWMGAPEVSFLKLAQGPVIRKASIYAHVVQESIVPLRKLAEGVERFDGWFGVYPLLVFPVRVYDRGALSGFISPRGHTEAWSDGGGRAGDGSTPYGVFVDLGAYGAPRAVKQGGVWDAKAMCREMEHWTRQQGGFEATYTDLFCTRREYRQMFDHALFDKVKDKARGGVGHLGVEPYDKVRTEPGLMDLSAELAAEDGRLKKAK
eukprot:g3059.t1